MGKAALPVTVDLHRHLEGSVRFATFLEIAREIRLPGTARELERRYHGRRTDPRTLRRFLARFSLLTGLYPSRDWIERVAREAVDDAAAEGLTHLELRFSPVHFARRMKADPVRCAEWILDAAERAARGRLQLRFLVTLGRDFPASVNAPSLEAAAAFRGRVVGLDVAGNEDRPIAPLAPLIRKGVRAGLRLTVHAGEGGGPREVRRALALGAERIGHGVRAVEDPALLGEMRRRRICFEMCLTSNRWTGAWDRISTHPIRRLLREGHRVTLNTDDPALLRTDMRREVAAARRAGLTASDLDALQIMGMKSRF